MMSRKNADFRKAFTLIELLVCIAIIVVLVGLIVVGAGRVRESGRRTICLSNLRQNAVAFASYANTWRDTMPFFGKADGFPSFTNAGIELEFGAQSFHWPLALQDELGGQFYNPTVSCPNSSTSDIVRQKGVKFLLSEYPPSFVMMSNYMYSMTFTIVPEAFVAGTDREVPSVRAPSKLSSVTFPSAKGVLIETNPYHRATRKPNERAGPTDLVGVAFVDGSCEHRKLQNFKAPVSSELFPVLSTVNGYRGVDR